MPVYTFTILNDPLATDGTLAHGVNGSGQIVGQYANNNTGINGFLLSGGTYTTIADPLATQHLTEAFGINDAGQIVGGYVTGPNGDHGFLYNAINGTVALGINDNGQIVGVYITGGGLRVHGFLLSDGTYTTLDDPSATISTQALGINNAGQTVG